MEDRHCPVPSHHPSHEWKAADAWVHCTGQAVVTPDGHEIARAQIAKHGQDRYPTVALQALKLAEETGELAGALLKSDGFGSDPRVRKEYADAGLALYELGNKLGLDLIQMMRELVETDDRRFG